MKKLLKLIIIAVMISMTSCATLFTGTTQEVTIDSTPPGAEIIIDGQTLGITPITVEVDRELDALTEGGKEISLHLDGYKSEGYELNAELNTIAILNLFNPLCWAIDAVTGAITKYEDNSNFQMIPLEGNEVEVTEAGEGTQE